MKRRTKLRLTVATLLLIPSSYYLGGYKVVDAKLEERIHDQLDELIVNEHNTSVSPKATPDDLEKVSQLTRYLKDEALKDEFKETIRSVQDQVALQHELLESSRHLVESTDYLSMNDEEVERNIDRAYEVNNTDIRHEILQLNQEVKDKTSSVKRAEKAMVALREEPNLANFYTAKSYVDGVAYTDVKGNMEGELGQLYSQITDELTHISELSEAEIQEAMEELRGQTYDFNASHSVIQQLSPAVYKAYSQFPDTDLVLFISDSKGELYQDYALSDQGIVVSHRLTSQEPVKGKLTNNPSTDTLSIGSITIKSVVNAQSADITVDPNFFELLHTFVNQEVVLIEGT